MSCRFQKSAVAVLAVAACLGVSNGWAQLTVDVQNTGGNAAGGRDQSYQVVFDATGEGGSGPAYVIANLPNGWASIPGSQWIGASPDQSNATRPGDQFAGDIRFRTIFTLSGADPGKVTLDFIMLADDNVDVFLNGNYIFLPHDPKDPQDPQYRQMFETPMKYTLDHGFLTGANTLEFLVHNTSGGPAGLNVSYAINDGKAPPGAGGDSDLYPDITPPGEYSQLAAPEPVDGATGQYFDVFLDLKLGGPLGLAFERYYASQLSASGYTTALGTNWMSNFDLGLKVSGTNAQVLLFTGKVLKFSETSETATDWTLVSPTDIPYTLSQSSSGFSLLNPYSGLYYGFSTAGVLATITDRSGNAIVVTQGPNGPAQANWGPCTLTFTYTGKQLTGVRDQAGREVTYGYTGTLLTSYTDVNQQLYTYSYTSAGLLTGLMTKMQLPLGETPTTQTYDSAGRVIAQADSNNNIVTFAYDGHGGTTITDPSGQITTQANDVNGSIGQLGDPLGGAAKFTYDEANRRTSITDRSGNTVS
ncbi:MAG: DUF6531 domain-containing protein [Acidobacteriota bacterium]|nr:DUF6531 domain-containing protein [Acidobacteriota bacterium]